MADLNPDHIPCRRYTSAGAEAGAEKDGLPRCGMCGYSYSAHADQPRLVAVGHTTHCPKTGEETSITPIGEREWIVLHSCGDWTWEASNFCGHCGDEMP